MEYIYNFTNGVKNQIGEEINDIIGQKDVIKKLNFYIKASNNGEYFPTLLFTGSHGLGKTHISKRLSKALNRDYIEINCTSIVNGSDFIGIIRDKVNGNNGATILMDESHALNKNITNMLLSVLNPTKDMINYYYDNGINYCFNLHNINFIFATTDAHEMFAPLKNRCEEVYFSVYEREDILSMLKLYLGEVEISCDLNELIDACRGRGRDVFILSANLKRHLFGSKKLNSEKWEEFKSVFNIYAKGLKREEFKLLKNIGNYGPISCANLALKMMVNQKNIKEELEVRLHELGLINSTTRGRVLTEEGKRYIYEYA